ncbi:glycerate kinase [Micromonospora sp. CA-259024]|uniref:glycerate kinase n=1 Tax=Micromonospora sp. CA-259024 TaxID=3239965 RepID=UPI003D942780
MSYVLLAPDKFKGSLTAAEVVHHLAAGLRQARPRVEVRGFPVADGGDGTLDAAISAGFRRVPVLATGPTGTLVRTAFARSDRVAVVELADACGQRRLRAGTASPLDASSYGAGEVIRAALDHGCREIVLGLGGSASTDGGAGLVGALGVRLLDDRGAELPLGGAALRRLHRVDLAGLHPAVRRARFVLASDVDNPLLGPAGAAAVYGPQKGATGADIAVLEAGLARWSKVVSAELGVDVAGRPGAGAAGGVGFAALAFLGARFRPGIELLLDLLGFGKLVAGAGLVVTGEGSLDAQSLHGKAPIGVAIAAGAAGVPAVAVAGQVGLGPDELRAAGIRAAYPLTDLEPDPQACLGRAAELVEEIAAVLAAEWIDPSGRPLSR